MLGGRQCPHKYEYAIIHICAAKLITRGFDIRTKIKELKMYYLKIYLINKKINLFSRYIKSIVQ